MLQPAHQGGVPARDLHAVDAQVEAVALVAALLPGLGSLGHDQRPGDQRRRLTRPAGLDRQGRKVDVIALEHDFLARRGLHRFRFHRDHGFQQRQHVHGLAQVFRRLRLTQEGQRLTDLAQFRRLALHAPGDPFHRAEQVDQDRHAECLAVPSHDILEQHGRAALGDQTGLDFRHFQFRRHGSFDAHKAACRLQPVENKIPERGISHVRFPCHRGRFSGARRR